MEEVLIDQYCMFVFFCFFASSLSLAISASRLRVTDLLLLNLSSLHDLCKVYHSLEHILQPTMFQISEQTEYHLLSNS